MNIYGKQSILRAIDPHLGYNYLTSSDLQLRENESFCNGYIKVGASDCQYRIGVLGGSTSDIYLNGSWIRPFYEKINSLLPVTIYSGAVSGYSSSQEVIKLIRDILPLDCNLIISVNGVNDLGFLQSVGSLYPMVHSHQKVCGDFMLGQGARRSKFFDGYSANNDNKLKILSDSNVAKSINYGTRYNVSPAELWIRNVGIMDSVCKRFGILYLCFLQPVYGVGRYKASPDEEACYDQFCAERKYDYRELVRSFYEEARQYAKNSCETIIDLVDCFEEMTLVYSDPRHPNEKGNRYLADIIFDRCRPFLDEN